MFWVALTGGASKITILSHRGNKFSYYFSSTRSKRRKSGNMFLKSIYQIVAERTLGSRLFQFRYSPFLQDTSDKYMCIAAMKWLSNGGINRSWNTFLSFILFSLSTDSADNLSPAGFDVVEKKGEIDSTTKIIRSPSTISINLFPIFREDRPTTWFLLNCILIKIERSAKEGLSRSSFFQRY